MKFCPECGSDVEGVKFCNNCGTKIPQSNSQTSGSTANNQNQGFSEKVLWEGKQSILFGLNDKLRFKATDSIEFKMKEDRYEITNYIIRIIHESTTKNSEELINFEDVKDVKTEQSLKDKIQGIGNLAIYLLDGTKFLMKGIKNPEEPRKIIMAQALEYQRSRNIMYKKEL